MKIALVGNPSVGKSLIFNQLTGLGVEVSNYPGSTAEMKGGSLCYQRRKLEVVDLPGIYALDGSSEEEEEILVRTFLSGGEADAVVVVMDGTRLERNLYLLIQVAEFGIPMVAVLNMVDEVTRQGLAIDTERLSAELGVPVLPTAASLGQNIAKIIPFAIERAVVPDLIVPYNTSIQAAIRSLGKMAGATRKDSLRALQGIGTDEVLLEAAATIAEQIEKQQHMTATQIIAANRHNAANRIATAVVSEAEKRLGFDADHLLASAFPGIPLLIITLLGMLTIVFVLGSYLEEQIVFLFEIYTVQPLLAAGWTPLAEAVGMSILLALQAGIGIAFPFVFIFYILISVIEDSGYMTRAAFLADNAMHRMGMHGGGIIPLVLGLGCNVPAIMGLRMLKSRRERMIGAFLITMVPCSARTVIILGIVAAFVGLAAAFSIYILVLSLIIFTGLLLSKYTPGEQFGMIMEMAPLRWPEPRQVLTKAWGRMQEFFFIAMPMLLVGSVILGLLDFVGLTAAFEALIAPFSETVLGLPAYAASALIFGILRKEMAFETLVILAGTSNLTAVLSPLQLTVFAVVSVLFVPCVSTIAVLAREMGYRITAAVTCYTVLLGIASGACINLLFG
ncbi:MAG: ferrous iron transport protein B [Methanomicrobiales archaeon]|nr:ferrous iron transport protein B [Methanomicrobiales archaeon]